jgi:hypothetical protein
VLLRLGSEHALQDLVAPRGVAFRFTWLLGAFAMASPGASRQNKDAIDLYASLMEEAKGRIEAIDHTLQHKTGLADQLEREFCTLQIRMLCELIALGCLVAHGDIRTGKLSKTHRAHHIIVGLERLHPQFYPRPVRQTDRGVEEIPGGYLTKEELVKLIGACGDTLHRGSAKNLLQPRALPRDAVVAWTQKIRTLLDIHWFTLSDGRPHYLCSMNGGEGGKVGVSYIPTKTIVQ